MHSSVPYSRARICARQHGRICRGMGRYVSVAAQILRTPVTGAGLFQAAWNTRAGRGGQIRCNYSAADDGQVIERELHEEATTSYLKVRSLLEHMSELQAGYAQDHWRF
jgi:hypothetical protein